MNYEEAVNYFLDIPRFAAKKHDLSGLRRFLESWETRTAALKSYTWPEPMERARSVRF